MLSSMTKASEGLGFPTLPARTQLKSLLLEEKNKVMEVAKWRTVASSLGNVVEFSGAGRLLHGARGGDK